MWCEYYIFFVATAALIKPWQVNWNSVDFSLHKTLSLCLLAHTFTHRFKTHVDTKPISAADCESVQRCLIWANSHFRTRLSVDFWSLWSVVQKLCCSGSPAFCVNWKLTQFDLPVCLHAVFCASPKACKQTKVISSSVTFFLLLRVTSQLLQVLCYFWLFEAALYVCLHQFTANAKRPWGKAMTEMVHKCLSALRHKVFYFN